ncbi:hypothetical protein [Caldalkalibacillus mannanilyticus]|uniref:hypothetical protein n=1 Tax=Caldalkalibacillus mannanilyticus TaxID=1418 RepID=UPI000A8DC8BD|nr:hypothetical protein [Caldalkalibacillus mannanilyticus]
MAISSHAIPRFIEEFRILKLESLKKDLHKLTPEELKLIKMEVESLIQSPNAGDSNE